MYLKSFNYCVSYNLNNMASSRHDADKENVHKTRIPLPMAPLPALPKHLLVDKRTVHKQENLHRRPLRTINAQCTDIPQPGPSNVVPHKTENPMNIDMKHVTMRQRSEDLDWHDTVFSDKRAKDENAVISSDDERYLDDKDSQRYFVENKKKNALGAVLSDGTPNLKVNLEPNRVRNIKRSLKRPHSRELQGLSPPTVARQEKPDDKVKRRLKFNESIEDRLRTPDFWKRSYMRCLCRDYTADVFEYLLGKEAKLLQMPRISSITRACVINWLMKINGADGNPAIVQTACWYFDSVLSIGYVQLDNLQLVAAACFWIAQKLNGLFIPAMRLVKYSNSAFTTGMLLAAERDVMIKLKFPNQPIVPQDYITYLSWWCDSRNAGEIEVAATFLAMCGLLVDRVLCDEYPSVVAAAAVKNALLLLRKKELMPRLRTCDVFKGADRKAANLPYTCSILRRAVRTVAGRFYEYKATVDHYGTPPYFIAQKVIRAATELTVIDARNTDGR